MSSMPYLQQRRLAIGLYKSSVSSLSFAITGLRSNFFTTLVTAFNNDAVLCLYATIMNTLFSNGDFERNFFSRGSQPKSGRGTNSSGRSEICGISFNMRGDAI